MAGVEIGDIVFNKKQLGRGVEFPDRYRVVGIKSDICELQDEDGVIHYEILSDYCTNALPLREKHTTMKQNTGGSTPEQYRLSVRLPLSDDRSKFVNVDLEAMDVIDALDLSGNMKDVQKAIWRMGKKSGTTEMYDINKMLFYTLREALKRKLLTDEEFYSKIDALGIGEKGANNE